MLLLQNKPRKVVAITNTILPSDFFQCNFNIDILDKEVDMDAINAEVIGPSGPVYMNFDLGPNGGHGSFQPEEMGMHEVLVTNEGEAVRGAPHFLRSMPKSKKDYDGKTDFS